MPKKNLDVERRIGGKCKIRKRACSSSSSSSLVQNYRLKRAILVGKKGGSSTPVPTWKVGSRPPVKNGESIKYQPSKGDEMSLSARKLAASLWEMNEVPSCGVKENKLEMEMRSRERIVKCSMKSNLSDPSHSHVSERMDQYRADCHRTRTSVVPQLGGLDSVYNGCIMEIETQSRGWTPSRYIVGVKTRLKDVSNHLITSKELLKVWSRFWGLEKQHSSSISLLSALRAELDQAHIQVNQLIQVQRSNCNEIDYLLKRFAEEKAAWKSKEQDRIYDAIASIAGELKVEKKLRRQTERLNKKLGKELADTKASLSQAVKGLESEKRARDILEQVCDELARGIREDRAEVEELKRESAKVREEVEKERQMLQLADVLREERVQMKLSDAKYQFEEKNEAVDKLRNELEVYLRSKLGEEKGDGVLNFDRDKEIEFLKTMLLRSCQNGEKGKDEGEIVNGEEHEGDDSGESDLHSIELNMDNNSKRYNWSYACGSAAQDDSKSISVDEKNGGRKSLSEKIKRSRISMESENSDSIEWDVSTKTQENSDILDWRKSFELVSQPWKKESEDEIERYKMVKDLRDHILSGSRIASSQGFASPTPHGGKSLHTLDPGSTVCGSPTVLQDSGLKAMLEGIEGECQS